MLSGTASELRIIPSRIWFTCGQGAAVGWGWGWGGGGAGRGGQLMVRWQRAVPRADRQVVCKMVRMGAGCAARVPQSRRPGGRGAMGHEHRVGVRIRV